VAGPLKKGSLNMGWDIIKLVLYLIVFCIILWGAYVTSKWLAGRNTIGGYSSRYMKILDKIQVSKESFFCIVQIGEKYFFAGISAGNVSLLSQLAEDDLVELRKNDTANPMDNVTNILMGLFNRSMEKKAELDEKEEYERGLKEYKRRGSRRYDDNTDDDDNNKECKTPLAVDKVIRKSRKKTDRFRKKY